MRRLPALDLRFLLLVCILLVQLVGCRGTGEPEREFAEVKGKVTHNGEPVKTGTVMFQPPSGALVSAPISPDGTYTIKAVVGTNSVRIVSVDLPTVADPSAPPPVGGVPPMLKSNIPEIYGTPNSPLTVEVTPAGNTADFDLE